MTKRFNSDLMLLTLKIMLHHFFLLKIDSFQIYSELVIIENHVCKKKIIQNHLFQDNSK